MPKLSPRIWRNGNSDFYVDEALVAADVYTDDVFAEIASHGFDGVWMRGKLYSLMRSAILPVLNDPKRDQRVDALNTVIKRGKRHGVGLWLYFNEPLTVATDHPLWEQHPDLRGRFHKDPIRKREVYDFCTSTPKAQAFMREATADVLGALPGVAGVILITASEYPTHCWSKYTTYQRSKGYLSHENNPFECDRCRGREQADIVAELVTAWADAAGTVTPSPRVMAWNWSWSMWYPEPQTEVIDRLPADVELLVDFERGSERMWRDRSILVEEYALSFVGPSERFIKSLEAAAKRNIPIHAKLQIGTTHEVPTVPNLPLIGNLYAKLCELYRLDIKGTMASWNFGLSMTLNTFAFGLFNEQPDRYADRDVFYRDLASRYLGIDDPTPLAAAWDAFAHAFDEYPFSVPMLYNGPLAYAPAYPLTLSRRGEKLGPTWIVHEWGDDPANCLGPFTLDEVIDAFGVMAARWREALLGYLAALCGDDAHGRRAQECSTARMIGSQLRSTHHIFAWFRWRGDGRDELDNVGRAIAEAELANVEEALSWVSSDPRLGFHQEPQAYLYDPPRMEAKIAALKRLLRQS